MQERNALEGMRQDFEAELQAARGEVAKAQDALVASEDRIRAAEAVDRARLEAEYQAKIGALQEEIQRLRDELSYRTQVGGAGLSAGDRGRGDWLDWRCDVGVMVE